MAVLFPEARDSARIEQVKTHPYFAPFRKYLDEKREEYLNTPIEPLPFHLYDQYFLNGDRNQYETLYFARRGRLEIFAESYLLYRRPEDLQALEDTIWAVCDEYTWVLPAHIDCFEDHYDTFIVDLFSAETGSALAEIWSLFRDELNPKVVKRLTDNVTSRIFDVYEGREFWWDSCEMNWASVCAGSVGVAYMYLAPDRFLKVKDRLNDTMRAFLRGYGTDGICTEGIGYWHYGFGYFLYYAQMLKEFTDGEEDLFRIPVVEKAAYFQQLMMMRKNYSVSFSDGSQFGGYVAGMTHKLREVFGKSVRILPEEYSVRDDFCHRFLKALRNLFWVDPDVPASEIPASGDTYFEGAQWYFSNREKFSLAAKGGHNDEPHNHNDVGAFLLMDNDGQILCDYGAGAYVKDYFRDETRYTFFCASSRGHNLPVIDGNYQAAGRNYAGRVYSCEDGFSLDIAGAYPEGTIEKLDRTVKLEEESFRLRDRFGFADSGHRVIERFVTQIRPEFFEGKARIGKYLLEASADGEQLRPVFSSEEVAVHDTEGYTVVYVIDYVLDDPSEFTLRLS